MPHTNLWHFSRPVSWLPFPNKVWALQGCRLCLIPQLPESPAGHSVEAPRDTSRPSSRLYSAPHACSPALPPEGFLPYLKPWAHSQGGFLARSTFLPLCLETFIVLVANEREKQAVLRKSCGPSLDTSRAEEQLTASSHGNGLSLKELLVQCASPQLFLSRE